MQAAAVIPARFQSKRFPGKVLANLCGKPVLQHVYDRTRQATRLERVVVATDDERVAECVRGFGGEVVMTSSEHRSGSDRIREALPRLGLDGVPLIINVQGCEPMIRPDCLDALIAAMGADGSARVGTLAIPLEGNELEDPHVVKVVTDRSGRALYFSRAPIPYHRESGDGLRCIPGAHWKHVGVYAYRRGALDEFVALPRSRLEELERLEQLRFLEAGIPLKVVHVEGTMLSVDTPADLEKVRQALEAPR